MYFANLMVSVPHQRAVIRVGRGVADEHVDTIEHLARAPDQHFERRLVRNARGDRHGASFAVLGVDGSGDLVTGCLLAARNDDARSRSRIRSEEHTSELQSLMRISYAGICLKKKNKIRITT